MGDKTQAEDVTAGLEILNALVFAISFIGMSVWAVYRLIKDATDSAG